jgi:hypothetical protein
MSRSCARHRRVPGAPRAWAGGGEMTGSWKLLKLWTAPVRNLDWVNARFGHR